MLAVDIKIEAFERETEEKCIRMRITVLKIVFWGGKSSVLWSQITFYGSVDALQ